MVSSEVTQPDVITLLSKSEAWSSVVRSSEEPGAVVGKWIESQVERLPGCRAAHHAVLHEDYRALANDPVHECAGVFTCTW